MNGADMIGAAWGWQGLRRGLAAGMAAVSLTLAGCTSPAPLPVVERAPAGAAPGPALWRVADADTTIYLFGTVHALPQGTQWFDPRVERAFASSDELVTEVDLSTIGSSGLSLKGAGMLPAGQSLRALMTPEAREAFEAAMVGLGLPVEAFDTMEPWLAAMSLTLLPVVRAGYQADSGVEAALGSRAEGKRRSGLERIEDQIALFDTMPMPAQLAYLEQAVAQTGRGAMALDAMVGEWLAGDAEDLAALINAEMIDPELHERLLTRRNSNWADWISGRLQQPGTVFVAVGAGHLAGADSVQDQLRARGFEVTRIWQ
ncbi:TraB/GumN family protein [Croceibacterium sp. TMG7-5b_MA50]|uniref:TraB/GumN family protein n=1 Tax=Croceibacterium sp. TMG7-5b_MA50 TaxID=3121290 RepID=UPI0032219929